MLEYWSLISATAHTGSSVCRLKGVFSYDFGIMQPLNCHSSAPYVVIVLHGFLMHTASEMGCFCH